MNARSLVLSTSVVLLCCGFLYIRRKGEAIPSKLRFLDVGLSAFGKSRSGDWKCTLLMTNRGPYAYTIAFCAEKLTSNGWERGGLYSDAIGDADTIGPQSLKTFELRLLDETPSSYRVRVDGGRTPSVLESWIMRRWPRFINTSWPLLKSGWSTSSPVHWDGPAQ